MRGVSLHDDLPTGVHTSRYGEVDAVCSTVPSCCRHYRVVSSEQLPRRSMVCISSTREAAKYNAMARDQTKGPSRLSKFLSSHALFCSWLMGLAHLYVGPKASSMARRVEVGFCAP